MSEIPTCPNCGAHVRVTNYALGKQVEHYDPAASFPTKQRGTAWRYCRVLVAELPRQQTARDAVVAVEEEA